MATVPLARPGSASVVADPTAPAFEGFTYGELSLLVGSSRPASLRWLAEFLAPAFRLGPRDAYRATVTLEEDSRRYKELRLGRPPVGTVELDCFVNDTDVIRLPAWASAPGATTAFQRRSRALYAVDRERRSVTVVSPEGNPTARTALMRVVRELAMNRSLRDGGVLLHAAGLAREGRAMLIAGPKHAGKTTLLLHLLRHTGADFVANDRVLLPSATSTTLRGMPSIVTLRPGTLAFFPGLQRDLQRRSYYYRRTLAEAAARPRPVRPWPDGRVGLSPAQLCALLGVAPTAEGTASVILFPRVTGSPDTGRLVDLTPDDARARLRRALLSAGLSKKTSDLVTFPDDPPAPDHEQLEALSGALAERVHCLECQLGTRSYETGALAAECLRVLAG